MATEISMSHRIGQIHREIIALNQPTLNSPSIEITGEIMTITNPLNGTFTEGYRLFANGNYIQDVPLDFSDLGTIDFPSVGDYPITIAAYGTHFNDSPISNSIILIMKGWMKVQNDIAYSAKLQTTYNERVSVSIPGAVHAYLI